MTTAIERKFGDGRVFSPQGPEFFLDDFETSWTDKAHVVAISNACPRPDRFIKLTAQKHFGKLTEGNAEKAARLATTEYLRQNFLYGLMVQMAEAKGDQTLFKDITETPHDSIVLPDYERTHVPDSYAAGEATGFANDDAFDIVARISRIFDYEISDTTKKTKILKALNILEDQIQASSTLHELKVNFFETMRPSSIHTSV